MVTLLFLVGSLQAMQSENGQMLPISNQEVTLNQASHDLWSILNQLRHRKVTQQEIDFYNKKYAKAYEEFLKRHQKS